MGGEKTGAGWEAYCVLLSLLFLVPAPLCHLVHRREGSALLSLPLHHARHVHHLAHLHGLDLDLAHRLVPLHDHVSTCVKRSDLVGVLSLLQMGKR